MEEKEDQFAAVHRNFRGQGRDIEEGFKAGTGGIAVPGVAIKLRVGEKYYRCRVESLFELEEVVRQKPGISRGAGVAGGGEKEAGAQAGEAAYSRFELTYVDCDDDVITVSSEAEFQEAISMMRGGTLKLTATMDEHEDVLEAAARLM